MSQNNLMSKSTNSKSFKNAGSPSFKINNINNINNNNNLNFNKLSNAADYNSSNNDRDDSLYDALSFGKQTPFRLDNINFEIANADANQSSDIYNLADYKSDNDHDDDLNETANINPNDINMINTNVDLEDKSLNRYSLVDLEYVNDTFLNENQLLNQNDRDLMNLNNNEANLNEEIILIDDGKNSFGNENYKLVNGKNPSKSRDFIVDLKDASIDEILLIADSGTGSKLDESKFEKPTETHRTPVSLNSRSKIPTPIKQEIKNNLDRNQKVANLNLNHAKSVEKLREKIISLVGNEESSDKPNKKIANKSEPNPQGNNYGAFKLYTFDSSEKLTYNDEGNENMDANKETNTTINTRQSPFIPLDKAKVNSKNTSMNNSQPEEKFSSQIKKTSSTTRGPIKKYRSGSTSALNINGKEKNNYKELNNGDERSSERPRPATQNEIIYAMDSDESTIIDNLINDPQKLKEKLKQSKIDREQLNQLQENYLKLLEQYAEAENFIDTFRLSSGHLVNGATPNLKMFQGSSTSNAQLYDQKLFQQLQDEQKLHQQHQQQSSLNSSLSTINSNIIRNLKKIREAGSAASGGNQSNISVSASRLVNEQQINSNHRIGPSSSSSGEQFQNFNSSSLINAETKLNANGQFKSDSGNNLKTPTPASSTSNVVFLNNHGNAKNQSGVIVLSKNSSNLSANKNNNNNNVNIDVENELNYSSNSEENDQENIVVEQTSKLGILVQTKVLEDKMHSFITLMNENQLSESEQKQVYESIKNDYKNLLKNYEQVKLNDMNQDVDMDIDLNQELSKMKDLLINIVQKMSDNLIEKSPSGSVYSQDRKSSDDLSSLSSYGNREEIMDQYNRLLDVFNDETVKEKTINSEIGFNRSAYLNQNTMNQIEQIKKTPKRQNQVNQAKNINEMTNIDQQSDDDTTIFSNKNNKTIKDNLRSSTKKTIVEQGRNTSDNKSSTKSPRIKQNPELPLNNNQKLNFNQRKTNKIGKDHDHELDAIPTQSNSKRNSSRTNRISNDSDRPNLSNDIAMSNMYRAKNSTSLNKNQGYDLQYTTSTLSESTSSVEEKRNYVSSKRSSTRPEISSNRIPTAKAYEGSDSGEDLLTLNSSKKNYEKASMSVAKSELTKNRHKPEESRVNVRSSTNPHNQTNHRNKNRKATALSREKSVEIIEDTENDHEVFSQYTTIDESESNVKSSNKKYAKKANTNQMMKRLTNEVEYLKKQILKNHLTKLASDSNSSSENERFKKIPRNQIYQEEFLDRQNVNYFSCCEMNPRTESKCSHNICTHLNQNLKGKNLRTVKLRTEKEAYFSDNFELNYSKKKRINEKLTKMSSTSSISSSCSCSTVKFESNQNETQHLSKNCVKPNSHKHSIFKMIF